MSHFEVLVNFAFDEATYFLIFGVMGLLTLFMVSVLWAYHRFMTRLKFPPKLIDFRHWSLFITPQFRAIIMVNAICLIPILLGITCVLSIEGVVNLPLDIACNVKTDPRDACRYGITDLLPSSYTVETAVSKTTRGQRRVARTGTMLIVMGGYAIASSLKLLIPMMESAYYKREDKSGANKLKELLKEEQMEQKDADPNKEVPSEAQTEAPVEDPEMPPIFTTHLWKRSALALMVYMNAGFQLALLRLSFSDIYRNNLTALLFVLFAIRISIKIGLTSFMCELLLTKPIEVTNQVVAIFTLLAAPNLFDFLVAYVALMGIQMLERVYIGPNEDVITNKFILMKRKFDKYMKSLQSKSKSTDDDVVEEDEEDQDQVDEDEGLEEEGDNEEMIGFLSTVCSDAAANYLVPIFFAFSWMLYDQSLILNSFGIPKHNAKFYMYFYLMMLPFQVIMDKICINIVECYHGWRVTDYLEYCAYRYIIRTTDWKGKDNCLDQTLAPHVRSIDQMCFSDQYYFVALLQTLGVMSWMLGMQILFIAEWNIFDDPATPMIMFCSLALCKIMHQMTVVSAGYLKIWVVRYKTYAQAGLQQGVMSALQNTSPNAVDPDKPPKPPPGSVHDGWPEPAQYDKIGMERYRVAFVAENQLWLQVAVTEMKDKKVIGQSRKELLDSLAQLLNEVSPENYAPGGLDDVERETFSFGAPPALDLARAASEVQRETFENSALRQLIRMWRERAQFMLHLQQVSAMVKLDSYQRRDACEICGKTLEMIALVVQPIYTLLHLASLYREQRDMSPLWNTPLWKHFYQTFTPTCTLCEDCAKFYHKRNTNIPVNEKRFQRLQVKKKTAYELMRRSEYPLIPLDNDMVTLLNLWLGWTRALANDENPVEFLPRFGFEGRSAAQVRRDMIMAQAKEEEDSLPSLSGDEEPEPGKVEEEDVKDPLKIDMNADDLKNPYPLRVPKSLQWHEKSIMLSWLRRAQQGLQAPQMTHWANITGTGQSQAASSSQTADQQGPEDDAGRRVRISQEDEVGS